MRILFVSNLYPPFELGGMEQLCQEIVDRFRGRGHTCHVLTSRHGVEGQSPSEEGVTRALHLEADVLYYRPLDFFLRRPWQELANRRTLRRVVAMFKPDVVFIWGMWNLSPRVAGWLEQRMPDRVAYNIESYWPLDTDPHTAYWRNPGRRKLTRALLWPAAKLALGILKFEHYPFRPQFHHVSCCSQYVVEVLTDAGILPAGAVVILNGIDPTPFTTNQDQEHERNGLLHLLYFGALLEHKGVHTAIEALGLLQQQGLADQLRLTIVGGGQPEYEARLHALTESLGLRGRVCFTGRVSRSEMPGILREHDVFLFTSIWAEPFGRTIIEAMAAGLAVIGANVGGSREIFRFCQEDLLFEPGDAQALAQQIQRFLGDPDLSRRLGQEGRQLVAERFTLERMVDEMEAWLGGVVQ